MCLKKKNGYQNNIYVKLKGSVQKSDKFTFFKNRFHWMNSLFWFYNQANPISGNKNYDDLKFYFFTCSSIKVVFKLLPKTFLKSGLI